MHFRKTLFLISILFVVELAAGQSRKIINVPDILGYQTLKCDFHMHTVFSDGTVWPTIRVEEAWREGLDAISITDHIEYRPHSKDIISGHNRSFEIAEPKAENLNVLLIQAAEITRGMPPGHLNALFIRNANLLDREDVNDALKEAREQGAFILWNHPGWKSQQPDTTLWWEEHSELLKNDLLHGIEVFNSRSYYPEALDWANEKKLTMFCNTDVHGPIGMSFELENSHRPMTLVFAKSRTLGGIKEALFNRRTAVYFDNTLMGEPDFLEPLFFASLEYGDSPLRLKNEETKYVQIKNNSDIDYELEMVQPGIGFDCQESVLLKAHHITTIELNGNSDEVIGMKELNVYYRVKNMFVSSEENLVVTFSFRNY
ncbi:MAG: histidinol-phosphatase [Prolixibacteraceae bacterium]|jgi:3',5'-nucleoside bisphosphate phosphatase|nr:histidinol-phosphatase [Prolixibacteraceae bacterium]MBT6763271.1 histidinol-phosphatase [Prolixibacteraceae bacterium]MBT6999179.1 histidinol-phosphatase [Prolixibacteraceae bacterium]MBT7395245.1 histidinol-phosphatase [Prolixibacteraceae bacterium]